MDKLCKLLLSTQSFFRYPAPRRNSCLPPGPTPTFSEKRDLASYIPAPKKDLNQWVRVGDDGCVQSVDPDTMQFVSSTRCGLDAYKGYCWLDNVSIDEYSGHMLSHAAVTALVDDPDVSVRVQHNAHWDFVYAAYKKLGPNSDGPAVDAVEDAFCMMRQFPSTQVQRAVQCPQDKCVAVCEDRKGQPMSDYPRTVAERCAATFLWWRSPYSVDECEANERMVYPPSACLLAYWMGRYHGFIDASD